MLRFALPTLIAFGFLCFVAVLRLLSELCKFDVSRRSEEHCCS